MITIVDKSDCCGCTACASVCSHAAISMTEDEEGFKYPVVDTDSCVGCGLCERVCPVLRYDKLENKDANPDVYALHSKDIFTWSNSSSGGVFSSLVRWTFNQGGCVFGVKYDKQLRVVHGKAETWDEALAFRGSKYVQSNLDGIYKQVKEELKKDRYVLFSGNPCQCEGLRGYLLKSYEKLIIVDIMCHCVPSPKVFSDYIDFIEKKARKKIGSIYMKDKTFGWGQQSPRIQFQDGEEWFNTPESRLWNQIFYSQLVSRPSCHKCRFTHYLHPGDITIGDFWGIEKNHADFFDKKGISLLFANTRKGQAVFKAIQSDFEYIESDTQRCVQPNLLHAVEPSNLRARFWEEYSRFRFRKMCTRYFGYEHKSILRGRLEECIRRIKSRCKRLFLQKN